MSPASKLRKDTHLLYTEVSLLLQNVTPIKYLFLETVWSVSERLVLYFASCPPCHAYLTRTEQTSIQALDVQGSLADMQQNQIGTCSQNSVPC